jgi:flagellar hook-associated protein 2
MTMTIGGLASGIDTDSIVSSLVTAANRPKVVLQAQETALEAKQSAYGTLSSRLTALKTSLTDIDTVSEFRAVSGTSSDDDVVGVSVTGDAVVGRFSVKVDQLAAASMEVSGAYSSRTASGTIGTGTLSISVGSTTTNVTVDASTSSLDDLAAAINDQVDGVTAYVMDTGDATNPYRLVVSGNDTGLDNAVTLDTSGLDPGTGSVPAFTEATAAADATVEINGVTITDSDNDIDGAIEGVTFEAHEVSADEVTVVVDRDADAMVESLNAFVTAWNGVMSHVRAQKVWNPDESLKGAFVGESVPNSVMQALQAQTSRSWSAGTSITSLSGLGITTNEDGDLELDEDTLRTAISDHFSDVVALFTDADNGVNASLQSVVDGFVDEDSGTVTARVDSLADQVDTMTTRISDFQARTDAYAARLRKQFTAMEVAMGRFQTAQSTLLALMPDSTSSSS